MSADKRLKVVLCWHMHQPEYRDLISGRYHLPWTYLHAIKDYVDMVSLLEEQPAARAVINFVPILLDQIADYAVQVQGHLNGRMCITDPLLAALDAPVLPVRLEDRSVLIRSCLKANKATLVNRFEPYKRLVEIAEWMINKPDAVIYLGEQYLVDLLVWYHLAWLGETVRRKDERIKQLIAKGGGFTLQERRLVLAVIGELLSTLVERYRALAERGQVELSMTPFAHPIGPLMLDFKSAREALPELPLPQSSGYPGGKERLHWHIREGLATFKKHFGIAPRGCWPSEGGISTALVRLLGEMGFSWTASGGSVLHNSLNRYGEKGEQDSHLAMYRPYRLAGKGDTACFFRDDGLSDLIGFTYSTWHADDAVNNLVHHLETIADGSCQGEHDCVVPIILDGENAWEHYPENGYYFLSGLYRRLSDHPKLKLATFSSCLDEGTHVGGLPALVAGSWVYGTFTTWIGDNDKNHGWDLLCMAKQTYDATLAAGRLSADQVSAATQQLAVCEGSDWFWWFGDYNPADAVSEFEHLYRVHLGNLYQILGVKPPEVLAQIISYGGGQPVHGGVMRPGQAALP